jgi:hypothetical protein
MAKSLIVPLRLRFVEQAAADQPAARKEKYHHRLMREAREKGKQLECQARIFNR